MAPGSTRRRHNAAARSRFALPPVPDAPMNHAADNPPPPAVSVAGLAKRYGATDAVADISFDVPAGCIFGLLGPNGAGKTTTLECLLGLRCPDLGAIHIHGIDALADPTRAKLLTGAQLQAAALQDKLTPRQALDLFAAFYPNPYASAELLARFDLADKADAPFSTLSGGQRQRLFLALALVNRPSLLVLDEPTAGLDPQARRTLRALIADFRAEGRTVLLSTHDLEEAAQLCDRVAIVDRGRLIANAPPADLIARSQAPSRITLRTAPLLPEPVVRGLPELVNAIPADEAWILETSAPSRLLAAIVRRADEAGAELIDFQLRRPTLEDVFIELTGRPWPQATDEVRQ
jgi:ABC-2 type transport system ATP-binding protein